MNNSNSGILRSLALGILGLFILFSYNNCGQSSGGSGFSGGIDTSSSSANSSLADDATGGLELQIIQDPVFVQEGDLGFNVGGFCETNDFADHEIIWKVDNVNGQSVISQKMVRKPCRSDKRFSLTVIFPQNYNFATPHTISIELRGKDEEGKVQASTTSLVNITTLN